MQPAIALLKAMAESATAKLSPEMSLESPIGFTWPLAKEIFSCSIGQEQEFLEDLATGNYVERVFENKVLLCPMSEEVHIAFREVCPQCHSADLDTQEMIHHFRCGYVGPEHGFSRAGRMVCPKCDYPLRHIGVDYERPSKIQVCNSCGWAGSTPITEGLCLGCGKKFDPDDAIEKKIYSYVITAQGALAAKEGVLVPKSNTDVIDVRHGTLSPTIVTMMYRNLEDQARRYKRPLSVICAHFDQFHKFKVDKGITVAAEVMERMIEILNSMVRTCDLITIIEEHMAIVILPETPETGARILGDRLIAKFRELSFEGIEDKVTISVGLASLGEGSGQIEKDLLQTVCKLSEEAFAQGGDRLRTPGNNAEE